MNISILEGVFSLYIPLTSTSQSVIIYLYQYRTKKDSLNLANDFSKQNNLIGSRNHI